MPKRKTFRETVAALKASTTPLRGSIKVAGALDAFAIDVSGAICLDIGASTGGFTSELLARGAARVYAVDAGHGQLRGSLRQDPRVVNMESTNVADVDERNVPEVIDVVTIDVSYLALRSAIAQLDRVRLAKAAHLVGLVKPMFELGLPSAPTDTSSLDNAVALVRASLDETAWTKLVVAQIDVRGAKGAVEGFVHTQRRP